MNTATRTLADFLLARIAEDEVEAKNASPASNRPSRWTFKVGLAEDEVRARRGGLPGARIASAWIGAEHIARWDPARVLAECAAKRRIVEECGWVTVMQHLAAVYADHPDYRQEWA